MCPQCDGIVGYKGDEDCLYLNLYIPEESEVYHPKWHKFSNPHPTDGHEANIKISNRKVVKGQRFRGFRSW